MSNRRQHLKMTKIRHSSLDLADPEIKKKHSDMLTRARNKLLTLGENLRYRKPDENHNNKLTKSMTQCTLDYFFKNFPTKQKHDDCADRANNGSKLALQKQMSLGSAPIEIRVSSFETDQEIEDEIFYPISRLESSNSAVDNSYDERRLQAEALALEKPRKKLSFKVPEVENLKKQKQNCLTLEKRKNCNQKTFVNNNTNNQNGGNITKPKSVSVRRNGFKLFGEHNSDNRKEGNTKYSDSDNDYTLGKGIKTFAGIGLSIATNGIHRTPSYEDYDLESQALRVVRTVGQAFEVCHKLSINAPEDNLEDEQDTTLTQDLLSDRLSDVASDKPKKDIISEGANSDKNSLPPDDSSIKDSYIESSIKQNRQLPPHLDILPPPPSNNNSKKPSLQAETYASPHSEKVTSNFNLENATNPLPPPGGGALSSHHELQLLREQLEQQKQQTQAAFAQLQLTREQLQAEQTARVEAQARTHQLLVHNRELVDHIAALVSHLQGGDKPVQQSNPPHINMPQQQHSPEASQDQPTQLDPNLVLQALGLGIPGLLDNRTTATCQSPLRSTFNPNGSGIFNFSYPSPLSLDSNFENPLLQRYHSLGTYPPLSPQYPLGLSQALPYLTQGLYNPMLFNNNYQLPSPTQASFYATLPRYTTNIENRLSPTTRHSEPRQIPSMHRNFNSPESVKDTGQKPQQVSSYQHEIASSKAPAAETTNNDLYKKPNFPSTSTPTSNQKQSGFQLSVPVLQRRHSSINLSQEYGEDTQSLCDRRPQANTESHQSRDFSSKYQNVTFEDESKDTHFIKPLSQMGTLTTTDSQGKVKVIVPVPGSCNDEEMDLLSNLRLSDELKFLNGPRISRSESDRLPNRSQIPQIQRDVWARHSYK